jgi:predicted phage terminase large subunit-like protein
MNDYDNDGHRKLFELERELWHRRCRQDFTAFCVESLSSQGLVPAAHHRLICAKLQAVANGLIDRLMILAPPGSAKTTYTSRLFPAWFFAFRPRSSIIAASHTASLAEENSGHVQRIVRDNTEVLGYGLANDAKDLWHPDTGGAYLDTGVGGTIRGFRADLAIIDDPIKSYDEAESKTLRDGTWTWFVSDLLSRLTPTGRIVLIATPMHQDDLMGRLQRLQGDRWHVLRMPAISEGDGDPLGRPEGQPLWGDDRYGYGTRLTDIRDQHEREGRLRDWFSQYQGLPQPPEGHIFKPDRMPIVDLLPYKPHEVIRAWDLGATRGGDPTVGLKLGRHLHPSGTDRFVVLDVQRTRGAPEEVRQLVLDVAAADGYSVKIALPQDPGQAGVDQITSYTSWLSGYPLISGRMTGSKETRAYAAAAMANIGNISMLEAPWNATLIEELASFPSGAHDDQVDALSLAFNTMHQSNLSVWLKL